MWKEHGDEFEVDALHDASREMQLEMMEGWFRQRYEDPAQHTPYSTVTTTSGVSNATSYWPPQAARRRWWR
jgi:hypothetical protein